MLRTQTAPSILGGLLLLAALLLGGAPAPAVAACATVAILALSSTGWTRDALKDPMARAALVVIGVMTLQLLPLPPGLLRVLDARSEAISARALSPFREDLRGSWRPLHLDPANGWAALQYVIGLFAAYVATRQATTKGHAQRIRLAAAWAPAIVAFLALAHKVTGQSEVYGLYRPHEAAPELVAPLLNPNHLSAYAGVGMILWVGLAIDGTLRGVGVPIAVLCGAVCALSTSRGGVAGAVIGLAVLVALNAALMRRDALRRQSTRPSGALQVGVLAALILAVGAWAGLAALVQDHRMGGGSKFATMAQLLRATREHRLTGTGVGGLYAAAAGSSGPISETTAPFAENMVLDLLIGLGPLAALAVLGLGARWLWQNRPRVRSTQPEDFSLFAALVSLLVHDQVDYALWLGATGYLAAVLAGMISGLRSYTPPQRGEIRVEEREVRLRRHQTRTVAMVAAVLCAGAGLVTGRFTSELDRARWREAAQGASSLDESALRGALRRHPGDPVLPMLGATLALRTRDARALRFVNRAIELSPSSSYNHILLAQVLATRGRRSQALLEVKLTAALSTQFHPQAARLLLAMRPTEEELDRVVPSGPLGGELLQTMGSEAITHPLGGAIDARLLARDPSHVQGWIRTANRARTRGDVPGETRAWQEVLRLRPAEPTGCVGLVDMHLSRTGDRAALEEAERALGRCSIGVRVSPEYLRRLAMVRARRSDTDGMRRTIEQLLEHTGADVDKRIEAFALRGSLELDLGNQSAALSAYELADSMSAPRHPYLPNVIQIARAMGDMGRVNNACMTLRENGELPESLRGPCTDPGTISAIEGVSPTP
jgi:hypothetical protein